MKFTLISQVILFVQKHGCHNNKSNAHLHLSAKKKFAFAKLLMLLIIFTHCYTLLKLNILLNSIATKFTATPGFHPECKLCSDNLGWLGQLFLQHVKGTQNSADTCFSELMSY